jgi:hypothetical protein
MNGKGEVVLEGIKSAQPIHLIAGADICPSPEGLQPAAVFIFDKQVSAET